jgi:hypothetical protein
VLKLSFYCDVTDRTIEIKIEGVKDSTPLYYLSQSQCPKTASPAGIYTA